MSTDLNRRLRFESGTIYCKHPSLCVIGKGINRIGRGERIRIDQKSHSRMGP